MSVYCFILFPALSTAVKEEILFIGAAEVNVLHMEEDAVSTVSCLYHIN